MGVCDFHEAGYVANVAETQEESEKDAHGG